VLWAPTPVRIPVLSPEEAWLMVDMMKDVVRRGTAYRSVWGAGFRVPSAGKTGTTNDGADVWYIGYTADLVAGVWMGMDRPQKIKSNAQGGELAAPAWTAFMTEVYRRKPAPPDWPRPDGIVARQIDRSTGQLANPFCPDSVLTTEYFIVGTEPVGECTLHSPFNLGTDSSGSPGAPGTPGAPGVSGAPGAPSVTAPSGSAPAHSTAPGAPPPRDTTNPFRLPPR